MIAARPGPGRATGIRVRDLEAHAEADVSARVVVNATGAWFEPVAEQLAARRPAAIRTTKGVHIVCRPLTTRALVLYSQVDGRLLFAIPRNGLTWIGTTDTDYAGDPANARATTADVEYLVASVRGLFPGLRMQDVLYTTAGVRALVRKRGSESSVSRMHRVVDGQPLGPPGLISVLGGKITGYRAIGEDVTDAVCRRLGAAGKRSSTAERPLPGAEGADNRGSVPPHLYDLHGARAADVLRLAAQAPGLGQRLSPRYPDIGAQVVYSVRHEHCMRLSDFLRRRTILGASEDQGWEAARPAAVLMAGALGWSPARMEEEIEAYRRDVASTQEYRR